MCAICYLDIRFQMKKKVPKKNIKSNGENVYVFKDSGSSLNIINEIDLEKISLRWFDRIWSTSW
jgi:hypothetical protein